MYPTIVMYILFGGGDLSFKQIRHCTCGSACDKQISVFKYYVDSLYLWTKICKCYSSLMKIINYIIRTITNLLFKHTNLRSASRSTFNEEGCFVPCVEVNVMSKIECRV